MIEHVSLFIFGAMIGVILMAAVFFYTPGTIIDKGFAAIETCEKSLPRDQHCIITATPQEKRNTYEYR